jgi:hypothetical protein
MSAVEASKYTIGIVGGGRSGLAMFGFLQKADIAEVAFVLDPDPQAPAAQAARAADVPTFTKIGDALDWRMPDFVFEISSDEETREKTRRLAAGADTHVVDQASARLMVELINENKRHIQAGVGETVQSLKKELLTTLDTSYALVRNINQVMSSMRMLSLNAAIESAKAGRAGKGFGVVADSMTKSVEAVRAITQEIDGVNGKLAATAGHIETVLEKLK